LDNRAVAQVLGEIADLLEIKGENVFKIRAYRTAADTVLAWPDPIDAMDDVQLRAIPGIGKDLAAKIRELVQSGLIVYHQELVQQFPASILGLLRLQGVGPKTVALLYTSLNIRSVEELTAAIHEGRLRGVKGMGAKKEALLLKAIEERERVAGRHLLSATAAMAAELLGYLSAHQPRVEFIPVGSLRRGCETCGDLDILAVGGGSELMDQFVAHPKVERVLGHGSTKSSVRLQGGFQADLRLVPPESRGAAMQYFTGSKSHNIALRDRAIQQGLKLNEYGLFRIDGEVRIAGDTEEGVYEALGLDWIAPELREHRGEIEAALARTLPNFVSAHDILGDLHMHTTETDGRDDLETMVAAAHKMGHRYIAITDHSKALAMANGLDEKRALAHAARIRAMNGRYEGLTVLAGIECDILADGTMDLSEDCLAELDFVVGSIHSQFTQETAQATDRMLRAIECPWVDVIGHPTARRLFKRDPVELDMDTVLAAAARHGVAMEINCNPQRLDLNDIHARAAREHGVRIVLSTDAHSTRELGFLTWGLCVARRAWLEPKDILNTLAPADMRRALRRNQRPATGSASARMTSTGAQK
jgi:DNA polymerase (family X)